MKDETKPDGKGLLLGELLRRSIAPRMAAEAERREHPRPLGLDETD
jgi:hypothetical protein